MFQNNYIHTTTPIVSKLNEVYQKPIYDHAKTCLISLIHCMSSGSFGTNTVIKGCNEIIEYKHKYLCSCYPFLLDSGGYSIISGAVKSNDIGKFITSYNDGIAYLGDHYDYAFSLDIPIFINEPSANTIQNIYELNYRSLTESISKITNFPRIQNKFNMVLQWKTLGHYKIWDHLYEKLNLKEFVSSYSIGGLVGLFEACPHVNFAPFIGPCYYWLFRYIEKQDFTKPLFIHILGQYHKNSRFMLLFLQHLFNSYLKEFNTSCFITFDTINYTLSSQFKSRIGVEVYYFDNDEFKTVHCYNLNNDILAQIYTTPESLQMFHNNWDNIKNDDPLIDTNFIVPLYIYSQCQLDKFFEYFIQKYQLVNIFTKYDTNQEVMPERWKKVLPQLNYEFQRLNKIYSDSLKDNLTKQLRESLMITYQFHDWYINDKSKEKLDYYMERFIAKINFPYTLA